MEWAFLFSGILLGSVIGVVVMYRLMQKQVAERQSTLQEANAHYAELESKYLAQQETSIRQEETLKHLQQEATQSLQHIERLTQDLKMESNLLQNAKEQAVRLEAELKAKIEEQEASKESFEALWHQKLQHFLTQELSQTREQLKKLAQVEDEERLQRFSGLVEPVKTMLDEYQNKLDAMNKDYLAKMGVLDHNVLKLTLAKDQLVSVLKQNKGTGTWGELQLMRLLELSGLKEGVHYEAQPTISTGKRPDIRVFLSDNRYVVVDSKTLQFSSKPLEAFEQEGIEAENPSLEVVLDAKSLVRSIKSAVEDLSKKNYTGHNVNETPDFVVLFLPQESMLSHALEEEPSLWEWAWQKQVLLSSPLTLIALLRMIAVGWNQKKMTENLLAVMEVGKKIHERVILMAERLVKVENQYATLGKSVEEMRKTYDGNRGLVKAVNELEELGVSSSKSLPEELKDAPHKLDALASPALGV